MVGRRDGFRRFVSSMSRRVPTSMHENMDRPAGFATASPGRRWQIGQSLYQYCRALLSTGVSTSVDAVLDS